MRPSDVFCDCVAVQVHGGANVGVPHHPLLHPDRRALCIQPRPVGVSEAVGADMPDAGAFGRIVKRLPNVRVTERLAAQFVRGSKNPILRGGEPGRLLPEFQEIQQLIRNDHIFGGLAGFDLIYELFYNRSLDADGLAQPIHIMPLQPQELRDSQAEADEQEHHSARANVVSERAQQAVEFRVREAARFAHPPACTLHLDQLHGIALRGHGAAPHRVIPKDADGAADMHFALGGERQILEPQFNRAGLQVC